MVSGWFFINAMLALTLVAAGAIIVAKVGEALNALVLCSSRVLLNATHTSFASVAETAMASTCTFTFVIFIHTGGLVEISSDRQTSFCATKAILVCRGVKA